MRPGGPSRRPPPADVRDAIGAAQAGRARWLLLGLLAGGLAAALAAALWLAREQQREAQQQARIERGRALFHGRAELPGRLAGHAQALPVQASRCLNCHQPPEAAARLPTVAPASAAASSADSLTLVAGPIGPGLNRAGLTELRSRRHAPASRFHADSLCRALQTGIDPAQVMLPSAMPRYTPSPSQCDDLWAYLVSS